MPGNNSMHPIYAFFWEMINLEFMIKFFIAYFIFVWCILILWVATDISSRTHNALYRIISILIIILFSPAGIFLYLLIRPRRVIYNDFTKEVEENLEILSEMVYERLEHAQNDDSICPYCNADVEHDFVICPHCHQSLKHSCSTCGKEIREGWKICPYCETKQNKKKKKPQKKSD